MPDQLQSTDVELLERFKQGNEAALAAVYRREYGSMVTEAGAALGPELAHYGGRVAQSAMLHGWSRRVDVLSIEDVRAMVSEAIQQEATVQRRKHAALHHGSGAAAGASRPHVRVPDVDAAVVLLLESVHAGPVDHEQAMRESAALRKQHASAHVQQASRGRGWMMPTVLVVVIGVAIVVLMQWINRNSVEYAATRALEADNARTVTSARGQRGSINLSDGSSGRIGSDSKLTTPADFGGLVRTLQLTGAASFTVAPGGSQPFIVRAGHAIVTVTGTRLTIRAFEEEPDVLVAVDDGAATVRAGKSDETTLAAGQALRIGKDGRVQMLDGAQRAAALAWVGDSLIFVDAPIRTVLPELRRWFDLEVSLADAAIGEQRVSLRVGLQSSGEALNALASAGGLTIGFDKDKKVVLSVATGGTAAARR